ICIFIKGGLALGVDFKGGRSYIVEFNKPVVASDVLVEVKKNFPEAGTEVKTYGAANKLKITTSYLADDDAQSADDKVLSGLTAGLEKYKDLKPQILSSSKVGATVANETKNTSFLAIAASLVVIFLYIIIRFRNINFSIGAIVALTHDVLAVIAIIGIFRMFGVVYEFDQIMVAALLTLVGYSINDTVVIFDRIRENIAASKGEALNTVINKAINETFSRTIITALTVFLVLIVLYIFGGEILAGFSFALLFGLFFGSYSTVFIASPIVLDFAKKDKELSRLNETKEVSSIELSKK
ncbi:MAG TPA: protein translocase subunit SecF, partial [Cytophagales bacterium]|nr:protein translocase subunit SecF [Cytophagales bacterium]